MNMKIMTPVTAAVLLTAALAAPAEAEAPRGVDGLWKTGGYGLVLSVQGDTLKWYEVTRISCLPAGDPLRRLGRAADGTVTFGTAKGPVLTVRAEGRDRGLAHVTGDVADKDLTRIGRLPERCARPAREDPVTTFDVFWRTLQENYVSFAAKHVDWRAVRDRYRPRVNARTGDDRLFTIMTDMIRPLGDPHTSVMRDERHFFLGRRPGTRLPVGDDLKPRIDKVVAAELGGPARTWGEGQLAYADLPGGLGYLRITGFGGYAGESGTLEEDRAELDRMLDEVFTPSRIRDLRGLVVDVRYNTGGYDDLGLRVASRLTDRPYVAYTKSARDDADDPAHRGRTRSVTVRPSRAPVYRGPIAFLTSDMTVSAGETFTMAMMGRTPEPRRIGGATQGAFSDILGRHLPNGWRFGLSNEDYRAPGGRSYEGVGIPPHERTPVFTEDELAAGRDSAFDQAVAWLSRPLSATASPASPPRSR
ncbi:S41 family peptidase [Sphaerisporangium fuscum]|uniref:S41 family peptidase n=1 Tax=Sphaerisporangium fuscum TaxID=2835868 RepID=UPI001BDCBF1F|nr:S41 family peptidase [Sphaerisporangium fuscum]